MTNPTQQDRGRDAPLGVARQPPIPSNSRPRQNPMEGSQHYDGEGADKTFAALDPGGGGWLALFRCRQSIGCRVDALTILVLACAFLCGVTAGAWLTDLAAKPRRAAPARR